MDSKKACDAYLGAIRRGSRKDAMEVVAGAREAGLSAGELYVEVFQPALREIGRLWQENEISVADEHLATAITQSAMANLFDQLATSHGGSPPTLIAACADVEKHEIGLRMLCDLLELEGWETIYLGAGVDLERLVEVVRKEQPVAIALSVTMAHHLPRLKVMSDGVRALMPENPSVIIMGGRALLERPELALEYGADLTASDARDAVRALQARVRE